MKSLAGSKRTAGTPLASPTKAAASAKRSRTQYDYYDEEDSDLPPEDQWSADADSGSEMSLDGEDERESMGDKYETAPSHPHKSQQASTDAEVNIPGPILNSTIQTDNIQPGHPPPAVSVPNRRVWPTAKAKTCGRCPCSRFGKQCNASGCACQGGATCQNPFRKLDLASLFGQEPVTLHPCFITWVRKQSTARLERTTTQSLFNIVFETVSMLKDFQEEVSGPYIEWRTKWDRLPAAKRNGGAGLDLKQELLRWGLTSRDLESIYYSFCRKDVWVETDHEWHCVACGGCKEWREWHCMNCKQCSYGLWRPCSSCRKREGDWSPDPGFGRLSDDEAEYWWTH